MARPDRPRRLIVNADDFGASEAVNQAVLRSHREGILTTASLMVNEPGLPEAVAIARQNPRLGVGLHLALLCGRSALSPEQIPGLAGKQGRFSDQPAWAGWRYFFHRSLRVQIEAELDAQFQRFHATGLALDHVNGHLHLHLHPVVLDILLRNARRWGVTRARLTRDSLRLDRQLSSGAWVYRITHALVFGVLAARARSRFDALGIRHTQRVFGLLRNARVDEPYLLKLLPRLPAGDSEVYSHPSAEPPGLEFQALASPKVKALAAAQNLALIRYQDL